MMGILRSEPQMNVHFPASLREICRVTALRISQNAHSDA